MQLMRFRTGELQWSESQCEHLFRVLEDCDEFAVREGGS